MKTFFGILAFCLLGCIGFYAYAITVNPASNVTADSDNTATTIVLRDASGNFSANVITVADSSIGTAKLSGTIATAQIGDSQVNTSKLASDSVSTVKLINSAVTAVKITALTIDSSKLAAASVNVEKLVTGAVETAKLASDAVSETKILNGAVTAGKIGSGAVTLVKISDDAIDTTKLYLFDGTADSGKVLCYRNSGAIGYCSDAPASGQNYCTCK